MGERIMIEIKSAELDFDTLRARRFGVRPIVDFLQRIYGLENYDYFRKANKARHEIPEETKTAVDERVFDETGKLFRVGWGKGLWYASMLRTNEVINYAGRIYFPDQDRKASLTVNIAFSDNRPSTILERLTQPACVIGEQCRAEQLRQLALAIPCGEEIVSNDGEIKIKLSELNKKLEKEFFVGRSGDPKEFRVYSYHMPGTNKLVGFSHDYREATFPGRLWIKELTYPVREIGIRDDEGRITGVVPVLYDQKIKDFGSLIIKGLYKSHKRPNGTNGGKIQIVPHVEDGLGVRVIPMRGGHPLRDRVAEQLGGNLRKWFGPDNVKEDDDIDPDNGRKDRFLCRRYKVYKEYYQGARPDFEVMIQSLEDFVSQMCEIGKFNPDLGMHDGPAHPLYKLKQVAAVAPDLWPNPVFPIDHSLAKKIASYEIAVSLARAQRIYPPPYEELE